MINAQDIKIGTAIRMDGKLYFCIDFLHVKPGKGNTFMRTKLKDVVDGYVLERRFNIGEKLEDVRVERRPYQYLYKEGEDYIFMNQETFEQVPIAHDLIEGVDFLKEEMVIDVVSDASTDTILFAELPVKVQLKITYTEPGLKGDTATNTLKPATVETGATVRVPLFINQGETIEIDTRDGSYVGRVKAYEAIIKGDNIPEPGVPESFKVLLKEFQSLALDVKILDENAEEVELREDVDGGDANQDLAPMIEGDGVFNNYEESESELGALGYKHGDLSEGEDNTIM